MSYGPKKGTRNYTFAPNMQNTKLNTQNISAIIFDLGGVILNIDYNRTSSAFKSIGLHNFDEKYSQAKQSKLFDNLETGKISEEDFFNELKKYFQRNISNIELENAWNAMLLDLPLERIDLLKKLSSQFRLFLLSNTNLIHYKAYSVYLNRTFGKMIFDEIFERQYLSFEMGMRKPDLEIFQFVLNENKLNPAETLFIDDSVQHIEGAKAAGINAIHLNSGKTILDLF